MTEPPMAPDDGLVQKNGPRLPMHRLTSQEHAAMGWSHGQYKDGYCLALMSGDDPDDVAEFMREAEDRGAQYVALWNLPEYTP
jgi:hypothetical protein